MDFTGGAASLWSPHHTTPYHIIRRVVQLKEKNHHHRYSNAIPHRENMVLVVLEERKNGLPRLLALLVVTAVLIFVAVP